MLLVKKGSFGPAVRYCQELLVAKGFLVAVDGDFGPATEAAVKQFQASQNLKADGIVGDKTWTALEVVGYNKAPSPVLDQQKAWLLGQIPEGTPTLPAATLRAACGTLGAKETPDGSNWGPEILQWVDGYNEHWGIPDSVRRPWCAMFVSGAIAAGLGYGPAPLWGDWQSHPFFDTKKGGGAFRGSSMDIEKWAKARKSWIAASASALAPAGAFFTMARGSSGSDPASSPSAGHTGFIVCDNGDGTVTTVEGNVSNKVGSLKRKKTSLRGWSTWW